LSARLDEVVVEPLVHQVPAGGHADLALVEEAAPGGEVDRLVDVGVVEHQQRRVPAELQVRPLEVPAGEFADPPARAGGPGERDDPHERVGDQGLADVDAARQHLQQARWQPGLLEDARHGDAAGDSGARVRLEQHGVAQRERGGHRPDAQDDRHVERRDDADHAGRYPPGH